MNADGNRLPITGFNVQSVVDRQSVGGIRAIAVTAGYYRVSVNKDKSKQNSTRGLF
jgi:hypothetical protein